MAASFPYKNAHLGNLIPLWVPVDMQTAANTGQRVDVTGYHRAVIVLFKAVGTANDDPIFTPLQATAITGGSTKAISITKIWSFLAVDVTGVANWTENSQAAADTYTDATSAEKGGMIALEIDCSKVDADGGYKFVGLTIPDTGTNANLGCAFILLLEKRDEGSATAANA